MSTGELTKPLTDPEIDTIQQKALELTDTVHTFLSDLDTVPLSRFLAHWPSHPYSTRVLAPRILPVVAYLPMLAAAANEKTAVIIKTLAAAAKHLFWGQTYTQADFGRDFLQNYGWTELIGLRGPIASRALACL